jgi:hypothetical protein
MICENCGIEHNGSYGSGRFCSQKCARGFSTKFNRKETSKKVSLKLSGGKQKNKCLYCDTIVKKNRHKFCGRECAFKYKKEQYIRNLEHKQVFSSQGNARTYLLYKNGNKCEICGTEVWNGKPVPLVMDHIDGNSDNHSFNNCRLICRNCDGQLDTYSGRNIGKGRKTKRMIKFKKYNGELV